MKRKLLTACLILILVSTLITGLLSFRFIKQVYIKGLSEKLISNGQLIQSILAEQRGDIDPNYYALAQSFERRIHLPITLIKDNGVAVSDSGDNSIIFINQSHNSGFKSALKDEIGIQLGRNPLTDVVVIKVWMPPVQVGEDRIIVKLSGDMEELEQSLSSFLRRIMVSVSLATIMALIIGYIFIHKITKPIRDLIVVSKLMAQGEFHKRLRVDTKDELEEMAETFNNMAGKMEKTIHALNQKNNRLNAMMVSMVEGIIAIDNEGIIFLANDVVKGILGIPGENMMGKGIFELIKSEQITNIIRDTYSTKEVHSCEVKVKKSKHKTLRVQTNMIRAPESNEPEGMIIILQDISYMCRVEALRRDFVVNASHELKTPLTTISGFLETLRMGNYKNDQQRERFLQIIENETNRLKRLVNNLLQLGFVEQFTANDEDGGAQIINISECVYNIQSVIGPLAQMKNIELNFMIPENIKLLLPNKDWLDQLLLNVIENAIKYTNEGGIVVVQLIKDQEEVIISVKDDGIGMSQEESLRIFERFYRVDKSRSAAVEGTGLGLSIVRHILKVLDGRIEVRSKLGVGSEFVIYLPVSDSISL